MGYDMDVWDLRRVSERAMINGHSRDLHLVISFWFDGSMPG